MENNSLFSLRNKGFGGSKRIKISRACDECRKRKVKCDGVQPCGRCRKSNAECVFAKLPPKRGPPKQYMETLENRLQRVEKALKSMTGSGQTLFDDVSIVEKMKQDSSLDTLNSVSTTLEDSNLFQLDKFTIDETGQAVYANEFNMRFDRIPKNENNHEYQNDTLSDMASISDSPISSSIASFYYNHVTTPSIVVTSNHQPWMIDEAPIPDLFSSRDIMNEVQYLTSVYFDHIHKYVPMIHKPSFLKQMHHSTQPPSRLLLFSMCAVASRWAPDHISNTNHLVPPGYTYYQKALELLDDFLDVPRVSTIQALILIVKYQEYVQRIGYHQRAYFYLGMAAQMCLDLRLDRLTEGDSYDIEVKKRTFWVTFTYDLLLSIEQGHTPYFDVHRCTTGFPLVTGEEGPALEELITNQNIFIQLCKVLSDIYTMSRRISIRQLAQGSDRNKDQIVEEQARLFSLHTHLENFLYEIPPSLIYPPTQETDKYPVDKQPMADPFIGFLHMIYHFSVILLHRHYALHPLPETEFSFVSYPHQTLCATSASNITQIVESLAERFQDYTFNYPTRGIQHTVHCLVMAAHVHKFEMSFEDKSQAARLQYLVTINRIQTLASQSPSIEFSKYGRQMTTAEKRLSAPVYQLLQPKQKTRRNTLSSLAEPFPHKPKPQPQPELYYNPYPQNYLTTEDYYSTFMLNKKIDSVMLTPSDLIIPPASEDDLMLDTTMLQYDPTPGMRQLFLTDNQVPWPNSIISDTQK